MGHKASDFLSDACSVIWFCVYADSCEFLADVGKIHAVIEHGAVPEVADCTTEEIDSQDSQYDQSESASVFLYCELPVKIIPKT